MMNEDFFDFPRKFPFGGKSEVFTTFIMIS